MSTPTLDPRIFNHLVNTGVITRDRVTRRPTPRNCRTCRAPITAAIEDEQAGTTRLELHPGYLTPLGELQALTNGRATYETDGTAAWWRDPMRILAHPANTVNVHTDHECGPFTFDTGPPPITRKQRDRISPTAPPPF